MWIKICGNTTLEDAQMAAEYGATAVGFVFAPSPRRVTVDAVRKITAQLPGTVEKYGVFVDEGFDEVVSTIEECGLTGVQLHSATDMGLRLREHFAARSTHGRLGIVPVLHYGAQLDAQLDALRQDHATDAVLVDSRTATMVGGTGLSYDWHGARSSFLRSAQHLRLIAAGGLRPENVAEAVYTLQPWGVDVASGVEGSPGHKDAAKVKEFIARAQAALAELKKTRQPAEA
jgi:phosphoribosylanthranilate isomerase